MISYRKDSTNNVNTQNRFPKRAEIKVKTANLNDYSYDKVNILLATIFATGAIIAGLFSYFH